MDIVECHVTSIKLTATKNKAVELVFRNLLILCLYEPVKASLDCFDVFDRCHKTTGRYLLGNHVTTVKITITILENIFLAAALHRK